MRRLTDYLNSWFPILVVLLALAVQWGIFTSKVVALEKSVSEVSEVKGDIKVIREILSSNATDHRRIEEEVSEVRRLVLRVNRP